MAIPVARVHLAMAHAALPALLPTPPKWKILTPLFPTPPCAVILPVSSPPKPSRADADQSWVASKSATKSPSKPGRASSCERWDSNKKSATSSSSSSSGSSASRASSGEKWGSSKLRPAVSRASSAERWDAHKKPRPPQQQQQQAADGIDDDGQSRTGSNDDMEFAGPGFHRVAGPERAPHANVVNGGALLTAARAVTSFALIR